LTCCRTDFTEAAIRFGDVVPKSPAITVPETARFTREVTP